MSKAQEMEFIDRSLPLLYITVFNPFMPLYKENIVSIYDILCEYLPMLQGTTSMLLMPYEWPKSIPGSFTISD